MSVYLTRSGSTLYEWHVEALGVIDRFVTAQGIMADESVRSRVRELFEIAAEWEEAVRTLTDIQEDEED